MNTPSNNFWYHILNALAQGVVWIVPISVLAFPHLGDLTISAVASILVSWLKANYFPQTPTA